MVSFKDYLFNQFPIRYWEEDSYKNGQGKGLLQRLMESLGTEWDQELLPKLEGVSDINDLLTTDSKYLVHLAWFLGNPPDTFYDEARYRKLLQYLTDIIKVKGTEESYHRLFFLLGVTVTLTYIPPTIPKYDGDFHHDTTVRYDSECPSCSDYDLAISDPDGNLSLVGWALGHYYTTRAKEILALLDALIKYVEPINMHLRNLTYNSDPVNSIPWVLTTGVWDDSRYWADAKIYRDNP